MAGGRRLKVFRTAAGFHDAYVAAPSRKAALAAWGTDADLFARGQAEEVTDPALTAEPLAQPGVVVRRSRGTAAEQIAALPPDRPPARVERVAEDEPPRARRRGAAASPPIPKLKPEPKPKPSRAALDAAEQAADAAAARNAEAREALARAEKELADRRRRLEREQAEELARLERARDEAAADYRRRLAEWRG